MGSYLNPGSKDDVLTLLVHLGYLTYNSIDESVTISNKEVMSMPSAR